MNALAVGPELDTTDVAPSIDRKRQDEDARDVGAVSRKDPWRRQRDDQIRFSVLPDSARRRCVRQHAAVAFARAIRDPSLEKSDLRFGERIQSDELFAVRVRLPWRHDAFSGELGDLRGV
jgi:hypothetical protein